MDRSSHSLFSRILLAALACFLLAPLSAFAIGDAPSIKDKAGVPGYPAVSITENLPERINAAYENIRWELIGAGTLAFMNGLQTFFGQLAYDAADYIATGGKGQSAVYYKKGFEGYMKDVAGSAAGDFIGSLSSAAFFQGAGFDLCRPPDPKTLLRIQLSLGQFLPGGTNSAFQRPEARCAFNDIIRNYEQVYQTLSNGEVFRNVEASLNPSSNDLGVTFLIFNRAQEFVHRRTENAEKDRKEGGGYQAIRDIVSGRIKTPSETIREQANQVLVKDPKANQAQINSFILEQAWEMGPSNLLKYTASVFLNTLASKTLARVMKDGIDIFDVFKRKKINLVRGADDLLETSREDKRQANISLRTPNLFRNASYDVLLEMQACPETRSTWNCVLDEGLGQALRSQGDAGAFTLQEAVDRGYLKSNWRLYPSTNAREERDPLCYTYGYCSGNLRKLRLMRILPVSLEFVANDPKNIERCSSERGCITLGEAIEGFVKCNARGERDASNPWCRMIDPNWALTALPQQCALSGFGDASLASGLSQRREECQDIQTCLQRNDQGECVGGYGHCVAEKTAYRFGGQECPARAASCRTYTPREKENETSDQAEVSYLRNTLEYGRCSEDTVGCMWYSTQRDPAGGRSDAWMGNVSQGPRVFFDATIESCEASGAGCTRLMSIKQGESSLNLVANSSFERQITNPPTLEGWMPLVGTDRGYVRPTVTAGELAADGVSAAHFSGGFVGGYRQVVDLSPGRTYVVSGFQRRLIESNSPRVLFGIRQYRSRADAETRINFVPSDVLARDFRTRDCALVSAAGNATGLIAPLQGEPANAAWERVQCSFTVNQQTRAGEILVQGNNALVDAIMLEEGSVATTYIDGLKPALREAHLKLPPDEFACTGEPNDHPSCAVYARICRQTEAGCDGYTDQNSGLSEVAAQVSTGDLCPETCVGYGEYRKLASSFDLVTSTTPDLSDTTEPRADFFIPSSAEQCTQEEAGCSEFTIADAASEGGENRAAFSSLRFCEKPANDTETYFTWEGSDAGGYQLRTWALKKRTTDKPGVLPADPAEATIGPNPGPRIILKRSADLFLQKNPALCNEANWRTGADPDCRQFYNTAGNVFYRYYTQTVLSTEQCKQYRLADSGPDDCTKTGGTYRAEDRSCTYQAFAPESGSCRLEATGCRAYAGAEAGNTLTVFTATGTLMTEITGATASTEALQVGDRSYRVDAPANGQGRIVITPRTPTTVSNLYRVSFWAKTSAQATLVVEAAAADGTGARAIGTTRLTTEWQRVSFGLYEGARGTQTRLSFAVSAGSAPAAFFLDEIAIQHIRDMAFVRKGTWDTPQQCNQNAYGVPEPQAMLGCRAYTNRAGQAVNVRQFTQLCRPTAIGCKAFVDTRNSLEVYEQRFTLDDAGTPSITRAPADRFVYAINDPAMQCPAAMASCRPFGKPVFSRDRQTITRFDTVYLKDDVRKYTEGLCRPSDLFCEEFRTGTGREFFKDPQAHTCEFREQVRLGASPGINEGVYSGWFVTGEPTPTPCYPNALASGQFFQLLRTGDATPPPGYQGWAGTCAPEENECTEFRDTNDRSNNLSGRPYYFINDERVDKTSCNTQVDPSRGCVLMRNMSDARLLYNTEATQRAYQAANLQAVTPIDCVERSTSAGCVAVRAGRCTGQETVITRRAGENGINATTQTSAPMPYVGGTCSADADCAGEVARTSGTISYRISTGTTFPATYVNLTAPATERRVADMRCDVPSRNDANLVVKVKVDRDCAQWLGCSSGETVYDPSANRYKEVCIQTALCDKAGEQGGGASYCANYVNRASTSTEPVLTKGAYFDAQAYSMRPNGVGSRDYSGYTIPNAFQLTDLTSKSLQPRDESRRMLAAVKMPPIDQTSLGGNVYRHSIPPTKSNQAEVIARVAMLPNNVQNPYFGLYQTLDTNTFLCRHRGTGMIGFWVKEEARAKPNQEVNCYLSFRGGNEANSFIQLANRLRTNALVSKQDVLLDQAYPKTLCRAYPETDAPFPSDIVMKWDMTTNPIRPLMVRSGYQDMNACAYDEECACSYKRVEYPGRIKPLFYASDSQAVPPGVCIGGPRDGQACLPSDVFEISSNSSTSTGAAIAQAANNAQSCGPAAGGGRCVAFTKTEVVRGIEGSCLEYDTTRSRGKLGDETFSCLTWNPSPIVGGKNDPYRYVQTAGYLPPQNAGQYYCLSKAKAPKELMLWQGNFRDDPTDNRIAGIKLLGYHDNFVSDGANLSLGDIGASLSAGAAAGGAVAGPYGAAAVAVSTFVGSFIGSSSSGGFKGSYFNNLRPEGSQAASQCEDADDDQDDDGPFDRDLAGLRLVATGRGRDATYTEAFYTLRSASIAAWFYGTGAPTDPQKRAAMHEYNFSHIEIKPFENPNGNGRLACGYQEDWVDGVTVDDYDDGEKTAVGDRQWRQAFFAEEDLQTHLTRGSEKVLMGSAIAGGSASPKVMPCVDTGAGTPAGATCYFKTWEIGYRAKDKPQKFKALDGETVSISDLARGPYTEACTTEKPYYAIRAVFQTPQSAQTTVSPTTPILPRDIRGPWNLAGFWVSTCAGRGTQDNRFIYMNVRLQSADICRDLAEVRSVKTGQDAAFTDRVWSQSKYSVPLLNIQYGQTFAPFSGALNTGSAGTDPLFQTGGKLAGSSAVRPPTFLASGFSTYYGLSGVGTPKDRYAYLTNVFARVYRVYKFSDQKIDKEDSTCESGLFQGRKCVLDAAPNATNASVDCRPSAGFGQCNTDTARQPAANIKVCNALSGINAGRSCTTGDQCHVSAFDPTGSSSSPRPLVTGCELRTEILTREDLDVGNNRDRMRQGWITGRLGWEQVPNSNPPRYRRVASGDTITNNVPSGDIIVDPADQRLEASALVSTYSRAEAAAQGAFRCQRGAVRIARGLDDDNDNGERAPSLSDGTPFNPSMPLGTPFCTGESESTSECPLEVVGTCTKTSGQNTLQDVGTCQVRWQGHQTPETTQIACYMDSDCAFTSNNFWRRSATAQWSNTTGFLRQGQLGAVSVTRSNATGNYSCSAATCPFYDVELGFTETLLTSSVGGMTVSETNRFPSATNNGGVYAVGACESLTALMAGRTGIALGTCSEGAVNEGQACLVASPTPAAFPLAQWASGERTCQSIGEQILPGEDRCSPVSMTVTGGMGPAPRCELSQREGHGMTAERYWLTSNTPEDKRNENTDNNTCTSEAGYRPDPTLCPDPMSEFCGLTTYDMTAAAARTQGGSLDRQQANVRLPTDVTIGHYTPAYLGFRYYPDTNYQYVDYYTPRPPRIAAPTAICPAGTSCGVQDLDKFSFNGITQGIVNVIGGQHRSVIKFFGWAAHEQMPLRKLSVDWGDARVETFDDVKLKNHKPFCSVQKECYSPASRFTGLTCENDNDCPLSAQACRQMGACKEKQNIVCGQDSDCRADRSQDTCVFRAFFGNNEGACEATPFEFAHVYTCPASAQQTLPSCMGQNFTGVTGQDFTASDIRAPAPGVPGTCYYGSVGTFVVEALGTLPTCTVAGTTGTGRTECETAYNRAFGTDAFAALAENVRSRVSCGPPATEEADAILPTATQARCSGDPSRFCRANLPNGATDCAAGDRCITAGLAPAGGCWDEINNTCRYTPRIFLQDNWGWCSGECRSARSGDMLQDGPGSFIKHAFGGCYTPIPLGAEAKDATRTNSQSTVPDSITSLRPFSELLGGGVDVVARKPTDFGSLECATNRPTGALTAGTTGTPPVPVGVPANDQRRNFRPWMVFPGSLQLRPRR